MDVGFSCKVLRVEATGVQWHLQDLLLQSNKVTEVAIQGNHTHTLRLKGMTPEDAGSLLSCGPPQVLSPAHCLRWWVRVAAPFTTLGARTFRPCSWTEADYKHPCFGVGN